MNNNNKRWWILGALCSALFSVGLDMTVLNVALPTLATELGATTSNLQWFANSYNLVLAALLLPAGLLGDRFGRKKMLIMALIIFGIGSIGCAYSTSAEMLIGMRIVLGIGAAFLMPLTISILPVLFKGKERTRAMTIWGTVNIIGIPLGPIIGGLLLKYFNWGSVFLINIPFIVVGLIAVATLLPKSKGSVAPKIDYLGILTSSIALVLITFAFIQAGEKGWVSPSVVGMAVTGVLVLVGFVLWQGKSKNPLIDLSLFRSASFTWGTILSTVVNFALFGLLFALPLFFQSVQGSNSLGTGLRLLPLVVGLMIGAITSDGIVTRIGRKFIVSMGFITMAIGIAIGSLTGLDSSYGFIAIWIVITGIGLGLALPTSMDAAIGELSPQRSGIGSSIIMALRQVGGAIGVAILGSIINSMYINNLDIVEFSTNIVNHVEKGVSAGVRIANQLQSNSLLFSVQNAFVNGMEKMLLVCSGIAITGSILALVFLPRDENNVEEDTHL